MFIKRLVSMKSRNIWTNEYYCNVDESRMLPLNLGGGSRLYYLQSTLIYKKAFFFSKEHNIAITPFHSMLVTLDLLLDNSVMNY